MLRKEFPIKSGIKGKKGQTIKLVVGEYLKDDGTVGKERSRAPYFYEYT